MRTIRDYKTGDDLLIFDTIEEMVKYSMDAVRPPVRYTVSQSAEQFRFLNNPGSYIGMWRNNKTPYLIQPMDTLTSTQFTGMIFVGPARTGKSDMFFNWLTHTAINDPADMMIIHMTQGVGRDWSLGDLQRNLYIEGNRNRPTELGKKLVPGRVNDNVFDKRFMNGMRLLIKHPTITELSGKTLPYVWVNDADNMTLNVVGSVGEDEKSAGKGTPFDLGRKRTQTYREFGMTVAEGSPAHDVPRTKFIPSSAHEAPHAPGLMALYNRGNRNRWYWSCPACGGKFEPSFSLLKWPDSKDFTEAAEQVYLPCPHDGFHMLPDMQFELNLGGKWIADGQQWLADGSIVGVPRRSNIASFWMKGPAAAFTTWTDLVLEYLRAEEEYERTGEEGALKKTVNTDQGEPYKPKTQDTGRLPETLKDRAEDWGGDATDPVVPRGVRFIVATVDVQAGLKPSFVCHFYGIGVGGDIWHVAMTKLRYSPTRMTEINGEQHPATIDPSSYPEDWEALRENVINRTFPLADGSGRRMPVKIVGCDSGGAPSSDTAGVASSVTESAYAFYAKLRREGAHQRFHLLKGSPSKTEPLKLRPTTGNVVPKSKYAALIGDVPVWLVNSNLVKDAVSNKLGRTDPGGGQIYFPSWAEDWLYTQLTAEVRTDKGTWERPNKHRKNEAFDLLAYCVALGDHPDIRLNWLDWTNPPGWAKDWDTNSMVILPPPLPGMEWMPRGETVVAKPRKTLDQLAEELG